MIEWVRREAWRHSLRAAVPSCPASPWKADENLRGDCRAELKPNRPPGSGGGAAADAATTVAECARSCCDDPTCVSWQHRRDVGCLHGGDVRLGMEKDGVPAWCSDHPPHRWRGQFLVGGRRTAGPTAAGGGSSATVVESRTTLASCDESTWNPGEEVGQCFGLGDVRPVASGSAVECMRACCGDPTCGAWQWNEVVRVPSTRYSSRPFVDYHSCSPDSIIWCLINIYIDVRDIIIGCVTRWLIIFHLSARLFLWIRNARLSGRGG